MNSIDLRELPGASEVYLCHDEGYFPVLINPQGSRNPRCPTRRRGACGYNWTVGCGALAGWR